MIVIVVDVIMSVCSVILGYIWIFMCTSFFDDLYWDITILNVVDDVCV